MMREAWEEPQLEGSRILAVDDEKGNLELMEAMLEPLGFEVETAAGGEEALEKMASSPPDLVILDVMMPGKDGFEVCREMKRPGAPYVPVIMVTALDGVEDRVRGIESGADDFLSKPVSRAELIARVRSLLRLKKAREGLERSYRAVSAISGVSRSLLRDFTEGQMEMETVLGNLATSLMRQGSACSPGWMFSFVRGDGGSGTVFRLRDGGEVEITPVELGPGAPIPAGGGETVRRLLGPEEAAEELRRLPSLRGLPLPAEGEIALLDDGRMFLMAGGYASRPTRFELDVLEHLALNSDYYRRIAGLLDETENAFRYTISALARAAEANDEDTGQHILRVNEYAALLAGELGLPGREVEAIGYSAQMHDVGKVHVHPDILRKPGKLTPEEWEMVKEHCQAGARILGDHPRLKMAAEIALTHHEKMDGSGYPRGLKGEEIPLPGRICMIADVYDALRSPRSYKPAFPHERAVEIILEGDGRTEPSHFDPDVLEAFRRRQGDFEDIYRMLEG